MNEPDPSPTESAAAQEQNPSPRGDPEGGMAAQPASAADHEPEAV